MSDESPRSKGAAELRERFLRAQTFVPEQFVIRWEEVLPGRRPPEEVFPVEEARNVSSNCLTLPSGLPPLPCNRKMSLNLTSVFLRSK